MSESLSEFVFKVKEMRQLQKEYFKTRDKEILAKSKAVEKKVDIMVDEFAVMDFELFSGLF